MVAHDDREGQPQWVVERADDQNGPFRFFKDNRAHGCKIERKRSLLGFRPFFNIIVRILDISNGRVDFQTVPKGRQCKPMRRKGTRGKVHAQVTFKRWPSQIGFESLFKPLGVVFDEVAELQELVFSVFY